MINIAGFLEYIDLFGTKPGFYIDRKAKFYTVVGGLFSLLAFAVCLMAFIFFSLDDLKRKFPMLTTTSSILQPENFQLLNFKEEKIYIPWRIIDSEQKFVNHSGLLYPVIGYISAEKKLINDSFEYQYKKLNFTLCNKTSMKNIPENYFSNVPLDQLYCIETDNININHSLSSFIDNIQLIIYLCEDQIDYDPENPKCLNHKKQLKTISEYNSLYIEIYYPTVQFQPTNLTHPILISYKKHYYNFSQHINKVDRLHLKKYILKEDLGSFFNKETNISYWGFGSLEHDFYLNLNEDLFIDEIATSQIYSLFIFFDSDIILYTRKYKKKLKIIAEGLPIMYVVFIIFGWIAKIFKLAEETKIMIELLFENLKEKPSNIKQYLQNALKEMNDKPVISSDNNNNNNFNCSDSNINYLEVQKKFPKRFSVLNQSPVKKFKKSDGSIFHNNISPFKNISNEIPSGKLIKKIQSNYLRNSYFVPRGTKRYVTVLLFPYRFYLCSVFLKNKFFIKDRSCCFSKKFVNVYKYLTQIIDITTYLSLQREFHIFKTEILDTQKLNMIEHQRKINVNDNYFYSKIKINPNEEN